MNDKQYDDKGREIISEEPSIPSNALEHGQEVVEVTGRVAFTKEKDGIDVLVRRHKSNGASKLSFVVNDVELASMYVQEPKPEERTVELKFEDRFSRNTPYYGAEFNQTEGRGFHCYCSVNAVDCECGNNGNIGTIADNLKQSGDDGKASVTCSKCGMITHYILKDFWRKKMEAALGCPVHTCDKCGAIVVVGTGCYDCATKYRYSCCCKK